jgi:four helix bundle protein
MNTEEMKKRTKAFALEVIRLCEELPEKPVTRLIRNQLLRAGTSVGSNYRASCRAKSGPDFIAKMGIVEEEADESMFWMEILMETGTVTSKRIEPLHREANEICAITVASIKTARGKYSRSTRNNPQSALRTPQSL